MIKSAWGAVALVVWAAILGVVSYSTFAEGDDSGQRIETAEQRLEQLEFEVSLLQNDVVTIRAVLDDMSELSQLAEWLPLLFMGMSGFAAGVGDYGELGEIPPDCQGVPAISPCQASSTSERVQLSLKAAPAASEPMGAEYVRLLLNGGSR